MLKLLRMSVGKLFQIHGPIHLTLLFLLYVNDISNASPLLHFILFTDDTIVFFSHKSLTSLSMTVNS